jgi:glutamate synthase domain-containing protein 3
MISINAQCKELKVVNETIKASINSEPVEVYNANHIHGLAAGLNNGEVIVQGNAGDYLGVLNNGAKIRVTENTGNYAADNMTAGKIIIDGNTTYGAAQYCYGGVFIVSGNAGDFSGTMNKGAIIIVGGNVGNEAATYMLKGDMIILGDAGENLANYLINGNVYIAGEWKSLGHNTKIEPINDKDITKLVDYFNNYGIEANPASFKKIVAASERPFYK